MADPSGTGRGAGAQEWRWKWQLRAACRDSPDNLFFHPPGDREPERSSRELAAKRFCRRCPVMKDCLAFSLQTAQPYGIWGGVTETERQQILRDEYDDDRAPRPCREDEP